ncbi:MAG: nuclear transport factor 2 family protein [Nitrospirae bacterium]|nr:nuclear transport factor 2 family protein [Candidatus Manganitrophaceae bacterium]
MSEKENIEVVQKMYAAFGKGDIPTIINSLTEEVDWQMIGPKEIPHAGPHRGRDQVAAFFEKVATGSDIQQFEPREYVAQGDKVVALGYYKGKAKATGKMYETEWAMVFTVRNGKVARFREYSDSANLVAAYK